ncbi:hypothetical protein [Streptomyces sp. NPDC052225]
MYVQRLTNGQFVLLSFGVTLPFAQVRDAQADVESGTTPGKHVVVLDDD